MSLTGYEFSYDHSDLVDRPAAGSWVGWWLVDDEDGGTLYKSDGATWTQQAPGVSATGGGPVAAADVSVDSTTLVGVGTDAQAVFEELDNAIVASDAGLAAHLADTSDAHAATAITNTAAGAIAATTVQAAINELDTEKAALASPTFTGTVTVPAPSNGTDAATKAYVDSVAQGLSIKASCRLATAAALPAVTLVGSTLVAVAVGVLTIDGQTVALGDRILVKDQVAGAQNGIYTCTTAGTGLVAFVLTRATDSDTSAEIVGSFTFIEEGTVNAASGFVNTNSGTITVGTTAITYTQFSGAGEITAGAGMTKSGNTLDVVGTANRIVVAADAVDVGSSVYTAGGTDVALADGGTGASTAAGARTNLATAPLAATYIVQTADSELSAEQALGALATGILKSTTTTGVLSIAAAGTDYYNPGGTDVAVADGGTGASTAAAARTNLGIATVVGGFEWTVIIKASDESVTNSTTLQADNELTFTGASGGIYEWEIVMIYVSPGGATPDIKYGFGEDGTVRSAFFASGLSTSDNAFVSAFASVNNNALGGGTATTNRVIIMRGGYVSNGAASGLMWAQNTVDAVNATTVKAGSLLRYRRIL